MKSRELIRLFVIILSILGLSLLIGNGLMTPILAFHKFLVRFFGWFFLLILLILTFLKFYANYYFVLRNASESDAKSKILTRTLLETTLQISRKIRNFISMIMFLIIIGAITILLIWLNSYLVKIPVY